MESISLTTPDEAALGRLQGRSGRNPPVYTVMLTMAHCRVVIARSCHSMAPIDAGMFSRCEQTSGEGCSTNVP
jgi:hypothetical protein